MTQLGRWFKCYVRGLHCVHVSVPFKRPIPHGSHATAAILTGRVQTEKEVVAFVCCFCGHRRESESFESVTNVVNYGYFETKNNSKIEVH